MSSQNMVMFMVKAFAICQKCNKKIKLKPKIGVEKQLIKNGWAVVEIKSKDMEVSYFLCPRCSKKIMLGELYE